MDTIARICVLLGGVGLVYLLITDAKNTKKMVNSIITSYNTGRMWSAFFGK